MGALPSKSLLSSQEIKSEKKFVYKERVYVRIIYKNGNDKSFEIKIHFFIFYTLVGLIVSENHVY